MYHQKANKDVETFVELMMSVIAERKIDIDSYIKQHNLIDESVTFCKNCKYLNVQTLRSLKDDLDQAKFPEEFMWELHDEDNTCHKFFIVARAVEDFRAATGKYPGLMDHNEDSP